MRSQDMKSEKRQPVICSHCHSEMVFAGEILKSIIGGHIYLKYVCPRRQGELGCGTTKMIPFQKEPKVKLRRLNSTSFVSA